MEMRPRIATILPCTSIASAIKFFVRLGFTLPTQEQLNEWDQYLILSHPNGSEIHLRETGADEEGWLEPLKNPFGIYVYSEQVEALGLEFRDEIIEAEKKPIQKEWGPDGCLVRVGWPVDQLKRENA